MATGNSNQVTEGSYINIPLMGRCIVLRHDEDSYSTLLTADPGSQSMTLRVRTSELKPEWMPGYARSA